MAVTKGRNSTLGTAQDTIGEQWSENKPKPVKQFGKPVSVGEGKVLIMIDLGTGIYIIIIMCNSLNHG